MNTIDMYRITNQLDDTTLDALVTRLEARARSRVRSCLLHSRYCGLIFAAFTRRPIATVSAARNASNSAGFKVNSSAPSCR